MKQTKFIIPGTVVAAMLMTGIDSLNWLNKEILKKNEKQSFGASTKTKEMGLTITVDTGSVQIHRIDQGSLKLDPFGDYTTFFRLDVRAGAGFVSKEAEEAEEELITQKFLFEVNRRVFGLLNSLTPREIEVLKKKIFEQKSITQASSEMKVKPQAVVAFMASIRKRVHQHLCRDYTAG